MGLGNKEIMAQNIRRCMQDAHVTQTDVCNTLHIPMPTFSDWINAKTYPRIDKIEMLANYFGVSKSALVEDFSISRRAESGTIEIQYTGPIAAHFDATPNEEHEYKAVPQEWLGHRKPDDFFLATVDGNSMYPHYHDGDEIFCLRCSDMGYSGRVGILVFGDGEATLKKIEYEPGKNWIDLVPFNPEYTTKRIEGADLEQCRVVGRVLRVIRTVDSL